MSPARPVSHQWVVIFSKGNSELFSLRLWFWCNLRSAHVMSQAEATVFEAVSSAVARLWKALRSPGAASK